MGTMNEWLQYSARRLLLASGILVFWPGVLLSETSGLVTFGGGWAGNYYEDASQSPTATGDLMARLALRSTTDSGYDHWRFSAGAQGAFALQDENAILAAISWEHGVRLKDGLFQFGLDVDHDFIPHKDAHNYDDASWTRLGGTAHTALRLDSADSSFLIRYRGGYDAFPDHDLDAFEHALTFKFTHSLDISTILGILLSGSHTVQTERNQVDTSGNATADPVHEFGFEGQIGLEHWLSATTGLTLDAGFARKTSNANLYFFGPGETIFVADGDEAFFDDFNSYSEWSLKTGFSHRTGSLLASLGIGIRQRRYDARPPFDDNDTPDISGTCETTRVDLTASLDVELSETSTLEASWFGFMITSNDEKLQSEGIGFRLGLKLLL